MLKKIGYAFLVLWGVITLLFFLFNVLPDDPARLTLGQRTDQTSIDNVRKLLRLDLPLYQQYLFYLNDISPLSFYTQDNILSDFNYFTVFNIGEYECIIKTPYLGRSYHSQKPVWDILIESLPGTLILAISAMVIGTTLGILLGIISAIKKGTIWDTTALITSVLGISTPSFFAGLIIAYLFGHVWNDITRLSMVGSLFEYDLHGNRHFAIKNLILPAITLGIRPMAIIAQLTRSTMLDVLNQDYIRTAKAKGLSKRRILFVHALPNALNPIITAISGWMAELLAGSFFIEFIFSWKGLGKITVDALDKFDFPVVMGSILFSASIFIIINVITDEVYKWVDPRMRNK